MTARRFRYIRISRRFPAADPDGTQCHGYRHLHLVDVRKGIDPKAGPSGGDFPGPAGDFDPVELDGNLAGAQQDAANGPCPDRRAAIPLPLVGRRAGAATTDGAGDGKIAESQAARAAIDADHAHS